MATAYCIIFPNAAKKNLHVIFKPPGSKIADIAQESVCLGSLPRTTQNECGSTHLHSPNFGGRNRRLRNSRPSIYPWLKSELEASLR